MALALICSPRDIDLELSRTVLGRRGFERQWATVAEQALALALARQPDVVLVDVFLAGSVELVQRLREDPATRSLSIVALAGDKADPREVPMLKLGANAVLRLPPGPGWDERLLRLANVPPRKAVRLPALLASCDGREEVPATGLNLSAHGMLVETWAPLEVSQEVVLLFRLGRQGPLHRARGRVVRQGAPRQFGIEFLDLEPAVRQAVEDFVNAPDNPRPPGDGLNSTP